MPSRWKTFPPAGTAVPIVSFTRMGSIPRASSAVTVVASSASARHMRSSKAAAAGSLVVFLLWVYYSSLIMFLGAEITAVHARHLRRVRPEEFAVPVTPGPARAATG